jgi:16S rRNA (cytosine1407-C5)-methyltransferase
MAKRRSRSIKPNPTVDPRTWAREYLTPSELELLNVSIANDLPISIRINQLKAQPAQAISKWEQSYEWTSSPIPFCPSGYWIENAEASPSKTIEHRLGYFYIQEAASMLPAELFDFDSLAEPLILDMAASPGGKTIHLVDRTMDKGLVIANDASRSRINALRIVLQNWGAINQAITNMQGEWFGSAYPETFDAVLLDAPCSMQGLRTSASHSMRPITENEVQSLADRQFHLLESALQTLKVGGQVVYSTCTLSPLENEAVVSRILDAYGNAVELEDIQSRLPIPAPAVTHFEGTPFHSQITRAARLWPHVFGTAGFFCAKFVKQGAIQPDKEINFWGGATKVKGTYLNSKETQDLCAQISEVYGIDLQTIMNDRALMLWEQNENIYMVPSKLASIHPDLPILSMGMLAGKPYPNGWQPAHEFVSRFGDLFTENVYTLDETFHTAWLRGEDIRGLSNANGLAGKILAIRDEDGRNFGRGKMLTNRLKNMLPTRLF